MHLALVAPAACCGIHHAVDMILVLSGYVSIQIW